MCVHHGRETREALAVKRQRTDKNKQWCFPFRPEQFRDHMKSQHTIDWEMYSALAPESQKTFFDNAKKRGMHQFMDSSSD